MAGGTTDALASDGLLEGTMLLSMIAVRAEGGVAGRSRGPVAVASERLRESAAGSSGVRLGGVVDVGWWGEMLVTSGHNSGHVRKDCDKTRLTGNGARPNKADEGSALGMDSSLAENPSDVHGDGVG